jgi:threonyl-tRNA synthetase
MSIYRDFGFDDVTVKFADRPPKRVGEDAVWDQAEHALKEATRAAGIEYSYNPGEGAFYGPKLEFVLKDAIGRDWQCGTLQVDLNMPGRLGAHYIDAQSQKRTPVMLHRAIFGSLERFFAIYLEHVAGKFPTWLAPEQAVLVTVSEKQTEYAERVRRELADSGLRVSVDAGSDKLGAKIRNARMMRHPYVVVIGDKEATAGTLSPRSRDDGELGSMAIGDFKARLVAEAAFPKPRVS